MRKAALVAIVTAIATLGAIPAWTQTYPNHPIRLVSPNPPGGANDVIARIVVNKLADVLGQPIVIDNRGGAGGTIGGEIVAHAVPDGYTLLAGSVSTHSFNPIIQPKLGYDPVKDFSPISIFAIAQNLLVVNPSLPVGNVKELVALAKAKPGTLNYASGGPGSTSHFAVALFVSTTGIDKQTVHIPYKGGAPSVTATIAGETQFYFGPMASMVSQVKAGKLKPLAVGGAARSPVLPEVPTVADSGFPAYKSFGWFGLLAPAGTPRLIVSRLNRAVVEAATAADVKQQLAQIGVDPANNSPEEFAAFIREQLEVHRRLVKELGIRFD
jgi:tripartite-type tricarboxylate transporter receptor subunit TctC